MNTSLNPVLGSLWRGTCCVLPQRTFIFGKKKTEPEALESVPQQPTEEEIEELERKKELLEKSRNKSRLEPHVYNRLHGLAQPMSEIEMAVEPLKKLRQKFGREGAASGVPLRALWPSRQELELMKEYEQVLYPLPITGMMKKAKDNKDILVQQVIDEQKSMRENMKSLAKWKKEVNEAFWKKKQEALEARQKREKLIEEVTKVLGVRVTPDDPQFKIALAQREDEEKKAARKLKKQAKQQKMMEKIQGLAVKAPEQPKQGEKGGPPELPDLGAGPPELRDGGGKDES